MSDDMRELSEYDLACPECGGRFLHVLAMVYEGVTYHDGRLEPEYDLSGGKAYYVNDDTLIICQGDPEGLGEDCEFEGALAEFNLSYGLGGFGHPRDGDPPEG